jgi:hypothetical protein
MIELAGFNADTEMIRANIRAAEVQLRLLRRALKLAEQAAGIRPLSKKRKPGQDGTPPAA